MACLFPSTLSAHLSLIHETLLCGVLPLCGSSFDLSHTMLAAAGVTFFLPALTQGSHRSLLSTSRLPTRHHGWGIPGPISENISVTHFVFPPMFLLHSCHPGRERRCGAGSTLESSPRKPTLQAVQCGANSGCHLALLCKNVTSAQNFFQFVSLPQMEPRGLLILVPIKCRLKMQGAGWASEAG